MNPSAPTGSNRWPAIVLLVATSVGVPGSLVALFKDKALQHPWLTLLCVVVWELIVLIGSLVTDVWSKLRSRWVDRLADWVDHFLQTLFSRYRRRYLDWIFYRHRDFDVKGLTTQSVYNLELEQVFVDLTIQPPPLGGSSADPLRPFPKDLTGRRSIWDYLTSESFKDHLALIGPPGSGKTTLLKKIALQMIGRQRPKIRQKLPILLFLREHTEAILATPPPSLADVASADLVRKQCSALLPPVWFKAKLNAGRCLVLLDGLDEVASLEIRQKVVAWVETQITAYPKNRFLISSRPHGYRTCPVSGVSVLEIQPFNRDQMRQFVNNWYRANEIHASGKLDPGVEMKAGEGAEDLLRRLGNSQTLTDLAVNPLLLTMIATVHRFRSSLPGRRVELYAEICEVFLGKRQRARGVEDALTPVQKQRVLQPLAHHLMSEKKREIPVENAAKIISEALRRVAGEKPGFAEVDFLKDIENGSGLLLERESGIYSFVHLAFQEYLTAVHIRESRLAEELVGQVRDPWWHEVILLYGAQADASGILAACLQPENPNVAEISLAIDCMREAREVELKWRNILASILNDGIESRETNRFRLAAEAILSRRLKDMLKVDNNTYIDLRYISNAEYQLFIDEKITLGKYHQPDHWKACRFLAGSALHPITGVRASDATDFCAWLTARSSEFAFRLPYAKEMERYKLNTTSTATELPEGFWTNTGFERVMWSTDLPYHLKKIIDSYQNSRSIHKPIYNDIDLDEIFGFNLTISQNLGFIRIFENKIYMREQLRIGDLNNVSVHDLDELCVGYRNTVRRTFNNKSFCGAFICRLDSSLARGCSFASEDLEHQRLTRWAWRTLFLNLMTIDKETNISTQKRWWKTNLTSEPKALDSLRAYANLALLELRINEWIPATEGIRIVKEKRSAHREMDTLPR